MSWQISVPASTANLGPGFDSVGLALDRYLRLSVTPHHVWKVTARSLFLRKFPQDDRHFIVQIAIKTAAAFGITLPPCSIKMSSDIPLASGLGSSAAAIVAGIELANLVGEMGLTQKEKLDLATQYEGHPDNVGASLYGGLVVSCQTGEGVELLPMGSLPICAITVSPKKELKTETSRGLLPPQLTHSQAVKAGSYANVLIAALLQQNWVTVGKMMKADVYHQPYRRALLPHFDEVEETAENEGAFGVALSGAGPTIACFVEEKRAESLYQSLNQAFPGMNVQFLTVDEQGTLTNTVMSKAK